MKRSKLKTGNLTVLSREASIRIAGGTGTSFWHDIAFATGLTAKALFVFGREGGRNAGICVH